MGEVLKEFKGVVMDLMSLSFKKIFVEYWEKVYR